LTTDLLFNAGVNEINDFLNSSNNNFMSYSALITKFKIKENFLKYYQVLSALRHFREKCTSNQNTLLWKILWK